MKIKEVLFLLLIFLLGFGNNGKGNDTTNLPVGRQVFLEKNVFESTGETSKIQPVTLKFKNAYIKDVFEILSKMTGVNIFFDATVPNQKINVYIDSLPFEQALDVLLKTNDLVKVDIDKNSIIVVPRAGERIKNYQDMVIKTFYLTNAEAKDMVNLLRTMVQTKQIFVNERLNALVVRDTKDNIKLSEQIIEANDRLGTQVDIELELVEVNRSRLENLGMQLAGGEGDKKAVLSLKEVNLTSISRNNMNLSLPSVWYELVKDKSSAKILANPRIRVTNKQKAKIIIGDNVPVEISTTTKDSEGKETTTTQVQYKQVGIKLDVEPTVHLDDRVTVKLSLEVSSIVSYTTQGYPLIRTRNVESFIRLKDGETKILGGLITDEERKGVSEIPFLNKIPFLGMLFTANRDEKIETEIVMKMTPYIVEKMEIASKEISKESSENISFSASIGTTDLSTEAPPPLPESKKEDVLSLSKVQKSVEGEETKKEESKKEDISPQPGMTSMIYINPEIKEITVGEEFSLEIKVNNVQELFGTPFYLLYNPKILQFVSTKEGAFLKQDGASTTFLFSNDTTRGRVIFGLTRLGQVGGVTGSGLLLTVNFKAIEKGNSSIDFQNASAKKASKEDSPPGVLAVTFKGSEVNVR